MAEEIIQVRPASPVIKSGGGDRRRSFEPPRSLISSGKGGPNYLRASTGSCHEICKHGKQEAHVTEAKESRPWRKPVTGNGRDILLTKKSGATAASKRTVVVKPTPSAGPEIQSSSKGNMEQNILTMSGHVNVDSEQASSDAKAIVSDESKASVVSESVIMLVEEGSLDTKNLSISEKSSTFLKAKPSPTPISRRMNLDVRKGFEGRKGVAGRKGIDGRTPFDEHKHEGTKLNHKSDINLCSAENYSESGKNVNEAQSIEGSDTAPEKTGFADGANLEINMEGESPGNADCNAKSDLLKKQSAAPKPKILLNKPSPSRIPSTLKPPSPVHPSSSLRSRTSAVNKVAEKFSTSKQEAKQVVKATAVSRSSSSSVNAEENTVTKKVRVIRVVSSVRRQKNFIKAEAIEPNDQGVQVQEDAVDAVKISPEKKPPASAKIKAASRASSLPPAPSVSKSTIRSRITYVQPRLKKSLDESEPKVAAKDPSTSGLRKGKAVNSETENRGPSKLKARNSAMVRETALTRRQSLKKRDVSSGAGVQKKTSDSKHLLRHPSFGRKKNVQVLFNKVIEETASRLVRTRKSKVLALVGAFETVISIQKKSSAGTKPKAKMIRSSSKIPC